MQLELVILKEQTPLAESPQRTEVPRGVCSGEEQRSEAQRKVEINDEQKR